MNIFNHHNVSKGNLNRLLAGLLLILAGIILFIDRYLRTGWMSFAIMPFVGVILYLWGLHLKNLFLVLAGGLFTGVGVGIWASMGLINQASPLLIKIGNLIFFMGLSWLAIYISSYLFLKPLWWSLVPAGILLGAGYCMISGLLNWTQLVLFIGLGTGLALLFWGMAARLFGLVIPGCLLVAIAPGIYFAWSSPITGNPLVYTGIMLVWFAFGWGLITLCGRLIIHHFIWWPLIPGGILAMVGCGLYIGGDPGNALNFISNTGSIALVIFGLYLILMRKGIHH